MEPKAPAFSFKFTKKTETQLKGKQQVLAKSKNQEEEEEERDFVTAIDGKEIRSSIVVKEKQDLVIPLIVNNCWRLKRSDLPKKARHEARLKRKEADEESQNENGKDEVRVEEEPDIEPTVLSLDEMAKRELMAEADVDNERWEKRGEKTSSRVIPLFMLNKVPEGFESNENFDVSIRAEEPTIDDYGNVPVEEFGLAMLRGMGWKPGEAVGGTFKQVVAPVEAVVRPKGLGLGAEVPKPAVKAKNSTSGAKTEVELELKRKACVCIVMGPHAGSYGTVEIFDEDCTRATIKLVLGNMSVTVPTAMLRVVSPEELKKEGKVLNRMTYDEYKSKDTRDKEKNRDRDRDKERKRDEKESRDHRRRDNDDRHHPFSSSSSRSHRERDDKSEDRRKHEKGHQESSDKERKDEGSFSWLEPHLRVRVIDKKYKRGKYYKEKVVILEVLTPKTCNCQTTDKIVLEDVESNMLETVIPREVNSKVMIVKGKHRREVGTLLESNRDKCQGMVQLLSDRSQVLRLEFDEMCEYTGDLNSLDY